MAILDLNKFVGISESFGITLDELIKGTAPEERTQEPEDKAPVVAPDKIVAPIRATHHIVSGILLSFGAMIKGLDMVMTRTRSNPRLSPQNALHP